MGVGQGRGRHDRRLEGDFGRRGDRRGGRGAGHERQGSILATGSRARRNSRSLGLGDEKAEELGKRLAAAEAEFQKLADEQKALGQDAKWLQFSASGPGVVPSGTNGSTEDIRVYENVAAIVESGGKTGEVLVGTLVQVGDGWRVIGAPRLAADGSGKFAAGFFFHPAIGAESRQTTGGPSEASQKLLADIEKLDAALQKAATVEEKAKLNAQRADLVEKVAEATDSPDERAMWLRQLADTVGTAVQSGSYPEGAKRLGELFDKLSGNERDRDLAAYVRFRQLFADYGLSFQVAKPDYQKIQAEMGREPGKIRQPTIPRARRRPRPCCSWR